jgi:hypothetical protein
VFTLILIGYTIWDLDQFSSLRRGLAVTVAGAAGTALVTAPALTAGAEAAAVRLLGSQRTVVGCRIAMGVTMALLLVLMI